LSVSLFILEYAWEQARAKTGGKPSSENSKPICDGTKCLRENKRVEKSIKNAVVFNSDCEKI